MPFVRSLSRCPSAVLPFLFAGLCTDGTQAKLRQRRQACAQATQSGSQRTRAHPVPPTPRLNLPLPTPTEDTTCGDGSQAHTTGLRWRLRAGPATGTTANEDDA